VVMGVKRKVSGVGRFFGLRAFSHTMDIMWL
jgi:hypothetical protein